MGLLLPAAPRRRPGGGRLCFLPLLITLAACWLVLGPGLSHPGSSSPPLSLAVRSPASEARTGGEAPRVAYAFYASDSRYACSALVNMARLRSLDGGLPPDTDLVLLLTDNKAIDKRVLRRAVEDYGALVYRPSDLGSVEEVRLPRPKGGHAGYYKDCFHKLGVFLLVRYERVVFLDADALLLRPPHHLLRLPPQLPLAAPRAYWLKDRSATTSWLLSLRPSVQTYRRLQDHLRTAEEQGRSEGLYDGELLSEALGHETTVLPPIYGLIDKSFLGPNHPAAVPMLDVLDGVVNGTEGWAVHFSAVGKPWMVEADLVRAQEPQAHPGLALFIDTWRREARQLCPYPMQAG